MAVYALCEICKCRRDKATPDSVTECVDKSAHKNHVAWCADYRPSRKDKRIRKIFGSDLTKGALSPYKAALSQEGQWKADFERGKLYPSERVAVQRGFSQVTDEWWQSVAVVQNRFKNPKRELHFVEVFKNLFGQRPVLSITAQEIETWMAKERERGLAIGSINRYLRPLRWIFNYAVEKEYVQSSPLKKIKDMKGARVHDRWMTEAEVKKLTDAAHKLGDTDLIDFIDVGVNTGFRLANLIQLTAARVQGNLIEAKATKSEVPYTVPMTPVFEPTISRLLYLRPTGPLLKTTKIGARFRAASKLAGLYPNKHDNERVTIHTLRHTFAVLYLERGGDLYDLSKLLGHASYDITDQVYGRWTRKRQDAQIKFMGTSIDRPQQQFKII